MGFDRLLGGSRALFCVVFLSGSASAGTVTGPAMVWQPVTVDFAGPAAVESDDTPNPFLDYRLHVTFTSPLGPVFDVPGFFAGDGQGGGSGSVWRARFTPDFSGVWSYTASFRAGDGVAVSLDPAAGTPVSFDGDTGTFYVGPRDLDAPGFLADGRLEYVGGHYLKQRHGDYWLKGGADSPENMLGYVGIDNTPDALHEFTSHVADWSPGDPDWDRADPPGVDSGRGLIGALNYLASVHVNSIYFLPMNIGGDAKDTWPYSAELDRFGDPDNDNLHYDISKLHQWEIVFAHAQRLGIHLHVVLNEAEAPNKLELDEATLDIERMLFYRELIARFAHHNAIQWNLSEEYDLNLSIPPDRIRDFAQYITDLDAYGHPITVHNAGHPDNSWTPFLGDDRFDITSFQRAGVSNGLGETIEDWRADSANAGRPLGIMIDEPASISSLSADEVRRRMTWDIYLSGGSVEWYVSSGDQTLENFRQYETVYLQTWYARKFLQDHLRFWTCAPMDELVTGEDTGRGGAEVLARPGHEYAVYFPDASPTGTIDLGVHAGTFVLRWYDPRIGDFAGQPVTLTEGGAVPLGAPPSDPELDWTALITRSCPADLDGNGDVGAFDFISVIGLWGPCPAGTCVADLDGDGVVGTGDLLLVIGHWGPCDA